MPRLQRLREYARKWRESMRKLVEVVKEIISNSIKLVQNVVKIVITAIGRAIKLIWEDAVNFVRSVVRLIVEGLRWPPEHIILPITRWLVDKSDRLRAAVESRDEVAIGVFLLVVLLACGGCALAIALASFG